MANIIILSSTTDGFTPVVCERIKQQLATDNQVIHQNIDDCQTINFEQFDSIIIGASIRYGKHSKSVLNFIEQHTALLNSKPCGFFSVNLVARKPEKRTPETNPYVKKFLNTIAWQPKAVGVFAGKLNYQKCSFFDRHMIRLIMKITKGPTDLTTNKEFTDWQDVAKFSDKIKLLVNRSSQ